MPLNNYAWLASAIVSWIIFFLLLDWSRIKYTVWGGFITVALQLLVDTGAMNLNLYRVESFYYILTSSTFFTFGVVFTIGVLYAQTLPENRWMQALNIIVATTLFSLQELLFIKVQVLEYISWSHAASIFVNILVFISYTWIVDSLGLNRAGKERGGYKLL
ncbi:hypothetical protein ACOBQJ_05950 [Pelotomaculum propionicicum]|uniref:hypothetical protein n=1 Tax=Pelotomaculum propionicicum TaxID=258475 RepID=UPI003B82AF9D